MAFLSSTFQNPYLPSWSFISAAYTAKAGDFLQVNTSSGSVTVTLPSNPGLNSVVSFADPYNTWSLNNLVVNGNGVNIAGSNTTLIGDVSSGTFYLYYVGSTIGWKLFQGVASVPGVQGPGGNTTIPNNAVAGNVPVFSSTQGNMTDSGILASSLATALSVTNLNNTLSSAVSTLNGVLAFNQTDLNYLFLKTAALSGTQLSMIDGIVDPLNNLVSVNTAQSTNYLLNSGTGTVGVAPTIGNQFLTISTTSQAISGGDQSASYVATNAFDGVYSTNGWLSSQSSGTAGTAYIGQDFGAGNAYPISQIIYFSTATAAYNASSVVVQYASFPTGPWVTAVTANVNSAVNTSSTITVPSSAGSNRCWRVTPAVNTTSYFGVFELSFQINITVGTNVATAAQAIVDSSASGYGFANAFDGNTSSAGNIYWQSNTNTSGVGYIGQDFGVNNSYAVSQIILWNYYSTGNYAPTSVLVQYSDNLTTWTTAGTYNYSTIQLAINVLSVPFSTGSHRAWRVLQNSNCVSGAWVVSEAQFQISGTLATVSNSAQAISGGDNGSQVASFAFDQSVSTYWISQQVGPAVQNNAYIGQDFGSGSAYSINNISIVPYTTGLGNNITSAFVQYSDDKTTWTTVTTITLNTVSATVANYSVPNTGSHRYWRMLANAYPNVSTSGWALYEVQFQTLLATKQISAPTQAISGGDYAGYPALAAFDNNLVSAWASSQQAAAVNGVSWIGQDFGSGSSVALTSIGLSQYSTAAANMSSVLLQYSDNLSSWITVSTVALNTTANTSFIFSVPSSAGSHRAWRLLANAAQGTSNSWFFSELIFYAATPIVSGLTLQSLALPSAVASPSSGRVFIQTDSSSVVPVINTDLIAYFSRDGGTTFVPTPLSLSEILADGTALYDSGVVSLSGAPVGNSTMTYKIVTANSKQIVLTGVGMQVRP